MENRTQFVELPSGRRIAYSQYGDPEGVPVVYCHGFLSSRREARIMHPFAVAENARIIAADRPGCGESDAQPDRKIGDWADDVELLANHLGLERFAVLGVSGGAPFALACACRIPGRILRCALVGPLGPIYLESLLDGLDWRTRLNFSAAHRTSLWSEFLFGPLTACFWSLYPQTLDSMRMATASVADLRELASPEIRRTLNQAVHDAMRDGARGARQELLLYTSDWMLPLDGIELETHLWHGEDDGTVPPSHSRWYAANLPNTHAHFLANEGHFSLPLRHAGRILRSLLATHQPDG